MFHRENSSTCFTSYYDIVPHLLVSEACVPFNSVPRLKLLRSTWPSCLGMCTIVSCLSEFPNSLQTAPKVLDAISSFLVVTSNPPTVFSLFGFDGRVSKTLTTELNQSTPICIVATFGYEDFYKMLAGPCIKILDRYDIHSVLQFLLMKLRTALGSAWLNNLQDLREVSIYIA